MAGARAKTKVLKGKAYSQDGLRIGLVGATGLVGQTFLQILSEQKTFKIGELRLFASEKSAGKKVKFQGKTLTLGLLNERTIQDLDVVFFSGGDDLSEKWAPKIVAEGAWVIDNSSTFRMHPDVPLVVPEVNGHILERQQRPQIIANPNCTTIQLVVLLKALMPFNFEQVFVSSYQAASGAGRDALLELQKHSRATKIPLESKYFARSLAFNVIPQIGSIVENGFSQEEIKVIRESKKILARNDFKISCTAVRVPVLNGHSEAVWVRFPKVVSPQEMSETLSKQEGLYVVDSNTAKGVTPREISGKNGVFVGRIHQDLDDPHTWVFWVVADNLRKGAAQNGFQIMERLLSH